MGNVSVETRCIVAISTAFLIAARPHGIRKINQDPTRNNGIEGSLTLQIGSQSLSKSGVESLMRFIGFATYSSNDKQFLGNPGKGEAVCAA